MMKNSLLISSFVAVMMIFCSIGLYFTLEWELYVHSRILLLILSLGFLYWVILFWIKLKIHNEQRTDKEWLRSQEELKKIKKEILKDSILSRALKLILIKRDWKLVDKTILPSVFEQMSNRNAKQVSAKDFPKKLFCKTIIYTFRCKLTGKVKVQKIRSQG